MKDYYKILEVSETASADEIKKSFRKLAKKYHPDTNGGNAEATRLFEEINEAYSILSDADKKEKYDTERKFGPQGHNGQNPFQQQENKTKSQGANPFAGFGAGNFKMDFGDMMFDELQKNKKSQKVSGGPIDFNDVSNQFAQFFGFSPKK